MLCNWYFVQRDMRNSIAGLREADNGNGPDSAVEDEYFDAQTEETNELLIRMPSSKKLDT